MSNNKKQNNMFKKFFLFVLICLFITGSFLFGVYFGVNSIDGKINFIKHNNYHAQVKNKNVKSDFLSKDVDFSLFWEVWDKVKEKYYDKDKITDTKLFYGALSGMVSGLEDPYSIFLNPEVNKEFNDELSGQFEGIGAEIGIRKKILTVISPLPNTPAEKAGLKTGDQILAIDDVPTLHMSLEQAVSLIRGKKGTEVVLSISRNNEDVKKVSIIRGNIDIISVSKSNIDSDIALIELSYFNKDTDDDFAKIVKEIINQKPKAIILDLRGNPGGYLNVAVKIAGYWIDNDTVVLEKYSNGNVEKHKSSGRASLKGIKTYVLLNEGSASASEILAGALQDYNLATVVGEQSFGKGSVQELISLADGSALKLTIAKWFTPKDNTIDGKGITPDVEVKMDMEDYDENRDPQLDEVLKLIKNNK